MAIMRSLMLAGMLALAPLPALAHEYSRADVAQTDQCIVAIMNGYSEENPQLGMGWVQLGSTRDIAEKFLVQYGDPEQACKLATAALIELVSGYGLGDN